MSPFASGRIARNAWAFSLTLVLAACCDITGSCSEVCEESTQLLTNSFNTYTVTGAPVATFSLSQHHRSASASCGDASGGAVTLSVTGIAPVPLRFEFQVQGVGATGLVVWNHAGSVPRLAPGQTLDLGQVARTPVRVDVGARALLSNIASVP
ncbi:MAG: hypothetical protein IT359_17110 [Gemmatimonadaceae bacterium]|nr:hypothetical protein [Gemmatimonadaceae bacterium]